MKLVCAKYGIELKLNENQVNVLVLENQLCAREVVYSLHTQCEGSEGIFVLSEKGKELKIDKSAQIVINPFSLEFNERKNLNKLYAQLENLAYDFAEEKEMVHSLVIGLLEKVIDASPYVNLTYDTECHWGDMFKNYGVKFDDPSGYILERLTEYIKILSYLKDIKMLCLVSVKSYLTENEMEELYKVATYCKIALLLLETREYGRLENERITIIDDDRCLIVK